MSNAESAHKRIVDHNMVSQPLSMMYTLALVDLDGVVYVGKNPIEHAASSLRSAADDGMYIEYTTNNSSRYQSVVAEQLQGFGLQVEPWQVITSSVVAARMVAHQVPAGSPVLAIGAPHLRDEVQKAGLTPVSSLEQQPVAVIQGWYPEITWNELAMAAFAVEHGAAYYVTNRDLTIPREHGIAPGCGALIQAVITATGVEPLQSAGKPESGMYDEARGLVAEHMAGMQHLEQHAVTVHSDYDDERAVLTGSGRTTQITPQQQPVQPIHIASCLAVGDRLDTDIEAGNRGGYDSLLVLTGVTDAQQVMLATASLRPTYIARDLRGLREVHEIPVLVEHTDTARIWHCGIATVVADQQGLHGTIHSEYQYADVEHTIDSHHALDMLRAACAASWYEMDHMEVSDEVLSRVVHDFCEIWYPNGRDLRMPVQGE